MRRIDEAAQSFGKPVVAPGLPAITVHALLDHDPAAVIRDDEPVEIEIEPILHGGAVDLGDQPARLGERPAIQPDALANARELVRRLARMPAAPAADMNAEFVREWRETALQRAEDARRDAGRVPIHPHDGAERLEPEWVGEPAQKFVTAIFEDDRFGDHRSEARH